MDGMKVPNPVLKHPVNAKCPCGSGRKFKKCCRSDMDSMLTKEDAEIYQELLDEFEGKEND